MKMRKEFVVIGLHIDRAHGGQRVSFESVEKLPPAVPAPGDDPLDSHMRSRGEFFELTVPTPHEFHMGAHVYVDVVNVSDADADATHEEVIGGRKNAG